MRSSRKQNGKNGPNVLIKKISSYTVCFRSRKLQTFEMSSNSFNRKLRGVVIPHRIRIVFYFLFIYFFIYFFFVALVCAIRTYIEFFHGVWDL